MDISCNSIDKVVVHLSWRSSTPLKVRLIMDKETNKPRGYAFIEYMHTRDMKTAYKQADGRKLDNRRVLVDVERGRTVPNWRPRRLGGGLGSTRVGGEEVNQKHSGRDQQQASGRPRSEEPRAREERLVEREREKSRDRPRERDRREKSRERSHDRTRDRDPREDRHHHRDRDRNRERDRERDYGRDRDRVRDRERDRDYSRDHERLRDRDRERDRTRERERDRDYERGGHERDRRYAHEREIEYDHVGMAPDLDHQGIKVRETDQFSQSRGRDYYDGPVKHGHEDEYGQYYQEKDEQYGHEPGVYHEHVNYGKEVGGDYQARGESEPPEEGEAPRDHDYEYHRSERSLSREYGH